MNTTTDRVRKSERLSKEEFSLFLKWVNKQQTLQDAADALGVSRQTLDRLRFRGSGKPKTIESVRQVTSQN